MNIQKIMLLLMTSVAAGTDLCEGKIRNKWLAAGAVCAGLLCLWKTPLQLPDRVLGGLLPLGALTVFFSIGALGGGDVKLLSMVGCFVGARAVLYCMLCAFLLAGAAAFCKMLRHRCFFRRLGRLAGYFNHVRLARRLDVYETEDGIRGTGTLHFSVPVLLGVWLYAEGLF